MKTRLLLILTTLVACGDDSSSPDAGPAVETLQPEPAGSPTGSVMGTFTNLGCLGDNAPEPAQGGALELTGYVRTAADPTAITEPPAATIEAFTLAGVSLQSSFADPAKDGRTAVSVPVTAAGFGGYVVVSFDGYLNYRFQVNRGVTGTIRDGWAWLVTQAELDSWATGLSLTLDPSKGILVGAVHDCDGFGIENVVIQVSGSTDGIYYLEGPTPGTCPTAQACATPFAVLEGATYTDESGRFAVANVNTGEVSVKAFGRLSEGGELTLLGSIQTKVSIDQITSVGIEPRVADK